MGVAVGIDIAKEFHWVRAIETASSEVLLDRRVDNRPGDLAALIDELTRLRAEHGALRVRIDVVGGLAGLRRAMLGGPGSPSFTFLAWPSTGLAKAASAVSTSPI